MTIRKTGMTHELSVLMVYILGSIPAFSLFYSRPATGDSGMLYLISFCIAAFTSVIASVMIWLVKRRNKRPMTELMLGLIPFALSTLCYLLILSGGSYALLELYLLGNTLALAVPYTCSVVYKILFPQSSTITMPYER